MATFSDDFNRANGGLGANWTIVVGSGPGAEIVSNQFMCLAGSFVENTCQYTGTSTSSVDQFIKATLVMPATGAYGEMGFRITNSSSPMYSVFFWQDEDQVTFQRKATPADNSSELVQTVTGVTIANGQTWGVTCEGTGSSVVIRGWLNPTNNAPDSASSWDSDTSPDFTFTNNPTTPVDSGNSVGLGGEQSSINQVGWDNFFGGDIPTAGGGGTNMFVVLMGM